MISTHILDTARGVPAASVAVVLERVETNGGSETCTEISRHSTDADGRVKEMVPYGTMLSGGKYRLTFDTGAYFAAAGIRSFYPTVTVLFVVRDAGQHHHVPLLLSPYGYSTYRGT
jgi:5-hydroxyisourate hydrolase